MKFRTIGKHLCCFTMVFALLLSMAAPVRAAAVSSDFAGGSGTESDPYLIETKGQLNNVRNDLDAHYQMIADIVFTEADFAEGGDFYNDGYGWTPIGASYSDAFTGTFDGNGHTITRLKIDIYGQSTHLRVGLFGYVEYARIKNLGMAGSEIKVTTTLYSAYAGGIVGEAFGARITNCYNTGSITANATKGAAYAGGIVGYAPDGATTTGCYNTGAIEAVSSGNTADVGGIVGSTSGNVTDCYNIGCVTGIATDGTACAGGIAGFACDYFTDTFIETCYNAGAVEAICTNGTAYDGGIVGEGCDITVTNCCYLNTISQGVGNGDETALSCTKVEMTQPNFYIGFDFDTVWTMEGSAAYLMPELQSVPMVNNVPFSGGSGTESDPYLIETKDQLNNVRNDLDAHYRMIADIVFTEADFSEDGDFYNYGQGWTPIGDSLDPNQVFSGSFDGNGHTITGLQIDLRGNSDTTAGLFEYVNYAEIKNLGMVASEIKATDTNSSAYAGSIAGYASDSIITNCFNTGTVETTASHNSHAGGIVGCADYDSTVITDCYNTGTVTAVSTGYGIVRAGGIVSEVQGTTITNCFNTGAVTATAVRTAYAGGIAAIANNVTISDCYNAGTVTASSSTNQRVYGGGILGCTSYNGMISNCYNTGAITVTSGSQDTIYSGGVAGYANGATLTSCYYLNTIDMGVGYGDDTAIACTEEEMKQQSTFVGFDFDRVWTMEGSASYLMPELQSVPMVGGADHTPGDINGDNELNNKDATRLFQYLSGWDVEVVESALDVNNDGKVNNKDATRLFQYLSGWDVEIY